MVKFSQKMHVLGSKQFAPISRGHFWAQNGVFELFGALEPPESALGGPSCWCMGIQVIIYLGLQGEGFWFKKIPSRAL